MFIKIDEKKIHCEMFYETEIESLFTGKKLRLNTIEFAVYSNDDYNYINSYIANTETIIIIDNDKETIWKKGENSSKYTVGVNRYIFSTKVTEVEIMERPSVTLNA